MRIAADHLLLPDGSLVPGGAVELGPGGDVVSAGISSDAADVVLPGRVLLPGAVNAHSHVFQRLLRGRVHRATDAADSFWTWRRQMYRVAEMLGPQELYDAARFGFYEMLRAGFTCVGEFHYLHHGPEGRPYADANAMGRAVLAAAQDVGMRIVLLDVLYERGGAGVELDPVQRRFADPSPELWRERVDALAAAATGADGYSLCAGVGAAPHSLRAVTRSGVALARDWAQVRAAVLHLHVSEQPAENAAVRAEHALTPVALLAADGVLGPRATAVHATHLTDHDVADLGDADANVCVCPTTERDLGDGVTPARRLAAAGATLAVGTDSHALIDPFEEARAVELDERMVGGRRVVHRDGAGRSGPALLGWLTTGGSRSLGLAPPLSPGAPGDLVALDLGHVSLRGWSQEHLVEQVVYGASPAAVTDVFVGGRRVLRDREHADETAILAAYDGLARRLDDG